MLTSRSFELAEIGVLIVSVMLHEVSHGWAALALGDDTAKRARRLTLNPLDHIDPVGSILVPGFLILVHAGFVWGWAKPVPVNVNRLRHPRNDAVWTGLAGPAMNLVLVGLTIAALRLWHPQLFTWTFSLLFVAALLNVALAFFNLLPIPPLDGSAVLERMIPSRHIGQYYALRPYTLGLVFVAVVVLQESGLYVHAFDWVFDRLASATGYG